MFILCHQCNVMSPQVYNQQSSLPDHNVSRSQCRVSSFFRFNFSRTRNEFHILRKEGEFRVAGSNKILRGRASSFASFLIKQNKKLDFCFLFVQFRIQNLILSSNTWTIKQYKISRNWAFFISFRVCQRSQEKMKSRSQFAIQKSKRADSQAQRIGENDFNSKVLRP